MADIDLIPKEYRFQRRLRRSLQWFVVALVSIVCITAMVRLALWYATSAEQRQIAGLRAKEQAIARAKAGIQEYEQQKAAAEKQLNTLQSLRTGPRIKLLLESLDAAHLSGIWFDEITAQRAAPVSATTT